MVVTVIVVVGGIRGGSYGCGVGSNGGSCGGRSDVVCGGKRGDPDRCFCSEKRCCGETGLLVF